MRVFVAGATGVIGRRLLPMLLEAGHEVTAMTRSGAKVEPLRKAGASAVVCDVYDAAALSSAVAAAQPDVVVHELTDLPAAIDPRKVAKQLAGNNRIRRQGTRNLVDAAVAAGATRIVAQSIAFAYETAGGAVKTEDDPLYLDAPPPWNDTAGAVHDLEQAVTGTPGIEGVVLRYGFFYGPGSAWAADGSTATQVRKRRFPIVGDGNGMLSFVHVDDAASATVAALDRGSGVYNVVDDDPAPAREVLPVFSEAVGAKPPRRVPRWLARLVAGSYAVMFTTELRGASNERAKRELGWEPRYSSWRQGFREALG